MLYLGFDNSGVTPAQALSSTGTAGGVNYINQSSSDAFASVTTIPGVSSKRYEGYTNWYIKNSIYPSIAAEQ